MSSNIPRHWVGVIGRLNIDPCTCRVSRADTHWIAGGVGSRVANTTKTPWVGADFLVDTDWDYCLVGELSENFLTSIDRRKCRNAEPFRVTAENGNFLPNYVNCKLGSFLYVFGFLSVTVTPSVVLCRCQ